MNAKKLMTAALAFMVTASACLAPATGMVIRIMGGEPHVEHDYSRDYLTFRVLTPGTISWKAIGNVTKTIEYSVDYGAWTSITSTSDGATISVAQGNLVRFRGSNTVYATDKSNYSGFEGGTATYDIEGNIMSLLYGDNFAESTTLPNSNYIFCSLFKKAPVISAENLILPATTLKPYCYRALFSYCTTLTKAPEFPATTLAQGCYWYMFERCAITEAPVLNATTLVNECYGHMFEECGLLNKITCIATSGFNASNCLADWVKNVAASGTFVKSSDAANWTSGASGIPSGWTARNVLLPPEVSFDGETIELECPTEGAEIYYKIGQASSFTKYTAPFEINSTVTVHAYSTIDGELSETVSRTCTYVPVELVAPSISCVNNLVTIACTTPRSAIHYRLGEQGEFSLYEQPIEIDADTVVEAYSTYKGQASTTVSMTCEYVQFHDYSADYLTFRVLTPGSICWKANGNLTKTIEYSIDNGAWTSITSTSEGATISVAQGNLVRFRGSNTAYATSKDAYSGFEGGTATYDIEGNIMSLLYGDNFAESTTLPDSNYIFCSLFKKAPVISAENLVLPAATLKNYCYRALFSWCETLTKAPALPATTLATGCYWYMFEQCAITEAPVLNATTLVNECYGHMFEGCGLLGRITCFATSGFGASKCLEGWVKNVAGDGAFVKAADVTSWTTGVNGIPTGWLVCEDVLLLPPEVSFDGETIELECDTAGAEIHYRLGQTGDFTLYTEPIPFIEDTIVEAYSTYKGHTSQTVTQTCEYVQETPFQMSNKELPTWRYGGNTITTPYSVNRIDGHSSSYSQGIFAFDTSIMLTAVQPAYLWFQHADQSADIYVNNVKVETHWGGYNSFFSDISEYIRRGRNDIRVALCNTTRSTLAPAAGDFNFNATLGNVKLFTSPVLPAMEYGYDGFHVTSTVSQASATVYVKTKVPAGATLVCEITDEDGFSWTDTKSSDGLELTFTTTISGNDLKLWDGTINPHLYNVKLEIYKDNDLYHRYERPYGFRYYEYVINQTVQGENYTGFLLNGKPYQLRGVCMHDDVEGKANALDDSDYDQEFAIIRELGCNFIRLAHYPHPKEVYDRCDQLGIIVQTEVPCVNKLQSTMPEDYYTHLTTQYMDMVQQHYNHPCIMFWGLSNETVTDDKAFGKAKIEGYYDLIKELDSERMVGYVMSYSYDNPSGAYNDPKVDWFGCNIYVGWYIDKTSNNPSNQLDTRLTNTTTSLSKPLAFSEYGCGGTQHCHSEDFMNTTIPGNTARHDIEYQMWLHEGHIAAIRNYPQLLFTSQWQLFDIAVSSRNEGYTECIDGVNVSTNDVLRRLNNKGLVERDHVTKKDTFYIYKAEWNPEPFVHICGKDYTKTTDRKIKCYTNDGDTLSMYVGDSQTPLETVAVVNHIAEFTATNFPSGVEIRVQGATKSDTVTFQ